MISLPEYIIVRCRQQGARTVESYRRNLNPRSLSVSSRGAERNAELQAFGKMAECALCFFFGMSPFKVNFGIYADDGVDVEAFGRKIDVKHTEVGHLLIWPANKRHFYHETRADTLVLVRGRPPSFEIVGWISKERFEKEHREALAANTMRLDAGTWYVDESELDDARSLLPRNWDPWADVRA